MKSGDWRADSTGCWVRPTANWSRRRSAGWIYWSWLLTPHKSWRATAAAAGKGKEMKMRRPTRRDGLASAGPGSVWAACGVYRVGTGYLYALPVTDYPTLALVCNCAMCAKRRHQASWIRHSTSRRCFLCPAYRIIPAGMFAHCCFVSCRRNSYNLSRMGGSSLLVSVSVSLRPPCLRRWIEIGNS